MPTREEILRQLGSDTEAWDVLVIGGGASGLSAALDAAARGYRTLLLERSDFAKGTSSRSTKLAHGGVRYLQQMNVRLVTDALHERGLMMRNAPHLVHDLAFVIPAYSFFSLPYYGMGLKVYEWLSGTLSLGASELLSSSDALTMLPGIRARGLKGGILYHDGQFDDARYAIALLRSFEDQGGVAINYVDVQGLVEEQGKVVGVRAADVESGDSFALRARVVVNATGVWSEQTLRMQTGAEAQQLLSVSQGTHLVLPREFLPSRTALMIPKTSDGRVLFAIPWHGVTIVGTTDVAVDGPLAEPHPRKDEITFLLDHVERYLGRRPKPDEILSRWSGLRPLVRQAGIATSKLSRDHSVLVSPAGLVTLIGGKWTTARRMGQDAIDRAAQVAGLRPVASPTAALRLHGWDVGQAHPATEWEKVYGSDLASLRALGQAEPGLDELIHPSLPYRRREVLWAARHEQARTTEDVLARRTRALFQDAQAALAVAGDVATLLGRELGRSEARIEQDRSAFVTLARGYLTN